ARPEIVWRYVTDIDLPGRFSEEFEGASWNEPDRQPGVGATFTGRNTHPAVGQWTTTCHVAEWDEPRAYAWHVGDPEHSAARWRFVIEKVPGGSRLRFHVRLGPGPSGLTPAIEAMPDKEPAIVARRQSEHRANMARTVAGIKELAEAEAAGATKPDSGFPGLRG
ncbi:MAG: SRPBCC family protein, partial [Acidimicrobiales bacterium]